MKKATFDPAVNLDLYFREGRDGRKELRFYDADGIAFDLEDEFELKTDFDLELEIEDNKIILIVVGSEVSNVRASYFYEIINTTKNRTWFCGTCHFTETTAAEITDVTDVTLILEGEPVEVTINEAGGDATEHFKGGFDASGNIFPGDADTLAGDFWRFTVGGTLDGGNWPAKTIAMALVNNPGQDVNNWRLY